MSTKNIQENLMDFSSPLSTKNVSNHEMNSGPGSNPFDTVLNIAETFDNIDFEKDLLNPTINDIDCGRESLGILHMDFEKLKFNDTNWLNIPNIQINNGTASSIITSPSLLNTAFLYSSRYSNVSNIKSSISSLPETLKSWELSKISFLNSFDTSSNINSISSLNKAFIDCNTSKIKYNENYNDDGHLLLQHGLNSIKQRVCSLPSTSYINDLVNDINIEDQKNKIRNANSCVRQFKKSHSLYKRTFSFSPALKPKKEDVDEEFNDSVFMEANYLASKIADGSIYKMADGETYSLENTLPPEWIDKYDEDLNEDIPKISSEDVFKTIDKVILPVNSENISENIQDNNPQTSKNSLSSSSSSSLSRNECVQNLTDIFNGDLNKKLSTSRLSQCSNNSKSRDAKSILHNLSEILCNDTPSAQQKSEGQNLLFNLADILCSNDARNSSHDQDQSEDSGHSSINQDVQIVDNQIEEVKPLDLSISKKKKHTDIGEVNVNLSKINNESTSKITSNTFKNNSVEEERSKNESAYSNNSRSLSYVKTSISDIPSLTKLKPKKANQKLVPEKGPLKATIPLGNMSKPKGMNGKIASTPPKYGQSGPVYQTKRTSTPKTESKIQPVAQSTPEGNSDIKKRIPISTHSKQRKSEGCISPVTRANSVNNDSGSELTKKNRTGSTPNLSSSLKNTSTANSTQVMFRRRSASDLKLQGGGEKLKRSNTIDKDSGISKTLSRVRENIEKARKSSVAGPKAISTATNGAQNKPVLAERNRVYTSSNIKPCNLVNRLKKSNGKENSIKNSFE